MEVNGGKNMTEPTEQPEREIETEPVGTNVGNIEDEIVGDQVADDDRT